MRSLLQTPLQKRAVEALGLVDAAHAWGTFAVGRRDGAALAILAAGITCTEAARLRCGQVTFLGSGQALLSEWRGAWQCQVRLDQTLAVRLMAWMSEVRGFDDHRRHLLCDADDQPLTRAGVGAILLRVEKRGRVR